MNVVFIHGRSQGGKDPAKLLETWNDTLSIGLEKAGLVLPKETKTFLPFYGKTLDDWIVKFETPTANIAINKGAPSGDPIAKFQSELLADIATNANISPAEIQAQYHGKASEKGLGNWEWVQAILRALDKNPTFGRMALEAFTRDVYCYLENKTISDAIHDIVRPVLLKGPCIVVAHSLGSIIAYKLLRELQNSANIKGLITVGSPLGVNAVRSRLLTPPLKMPANSPFWYNAYDDGDLVALRGLSPDMWPIKPAIENNDSVQNSTENQHGIVGYLNDANIARKIHASLC
jgi:hypothetical protein